MIGITNRGNIFDRTAQFRSFVKVRSKTPHGDASVPQSKKEMIDEIRQFNHETTNVFKDVNNIAGKLTKLTERLWCVSV